MKIIIINGPNLNLLGSREPHVYGNQSFEDYLVSLQEEFKGQQIDYYQSNVEGEIINMLQEASKAYDGIVLNAGGYTHTSVAIGDAVAAIKTPVVEVHISNIFSREEYRHKSLIAPHARGSIIGFGLHSYSLGLHSFMKTDRH